MLVIFYNLASFANTTDISKKQDNHVVIPNTSVISEEIYTPVQLPTNHMIESNHNVRNTFFALGTFSFAICVYFYNQAKNVSVESNVSGSTSLEQYEKQREEHNQIQKRYWLSASTGMGFWASGLTIHLLERAEKKKQENNTEE